VDTPEHRKDIAKETGKLIRAGFRVDTMPTEAVRSAKWFCDCAKNAKESK
jgi:hypothetical protein